MAFRKISELSSSLTPSGSGIIPIVINGTTFGTTLDAIKDQINSVLTPQYASSSITSSVDTLIGNVSSLNTFTSSADSRLDSLEIFTGSLNDYYATDQELLELREYFNTYSSSNNTVNTQQNIRLDALDGLEIATGSLLTQIETEKGRIDAILLSSDADKDSFKEIVDLINSVDTENDNAFGTYVLNTNDRLDSLEIESGSSSGRLNKIESVSGSWITMGDLPPQPTPHPTQVPVDLSLIVGRLDKLEIESGSIRDEFNSFTSSYLIVSQSFNDRISTLEGYHIPEPTSTPTATPNPTPTSTIAPTPTIAPNPTPTSTIAPTPNATPVPTVEPDPTPTPTTDYTLFTYMIVWRRNTVANGMLYDFTRLDGNTNDYFYSNEQIKCIYETFGTGGGNFWYIAVGDNSEGLISVGDNSWNRVSISDPTDIVAPFSSTTRAVWNDTTDRMGNGPQHYIITFVSGEVTNLVSFDSIGDVSGCVPYIDPTPTPTATVAPTPTATEEVSYTTIPDSVFEQRLIDLGHDTAPIDGKVPTDNISGLTSLTVNNENISDLTGIEDFTSLTYLQCTYLQLTSLDVSNNTALIYLHCFNNNISSLDVSNNTALIHLNCRDNDLTSLDIRNGSNTNLTNFYSTNNPDLTCIFVDDAAYSTTNWTSVDANSTFVNNESECSNLPTPTPTETVAPPSPTATPNATPNPTPTSTVAPPSPTSTPESTPSSTFNLLLVRILNVATYYMSNSMNGNVGGTFDTNNQTVTFNEMTQWMCDNDGHISSAYANQGNAQYPHIFIENGNSVEVGSTIYRDSSGTLFTDEGFSLYMTHGPLTAASGHSWVSVNELSQITSVTQFTCSTPTSTPTATPNPTPTSTVEPTPYPSATPSPTPTSTVAPTPNPTPNPTPTSTSNIQDIYLTLYINNDGGVNPWSGNSTYNDVQNHLCTYGATSTNGATRQTDGDPDNPQTGDRFYAGGFPLEPFGRKFLKSNPIHSADIATWRWIDVDNDGYITVSGFTCNTPTSTPNATPNPTPTSTVAPPSPTSTVAPVSCISAAPLNINVETEYDSNTNTTDRKYITSDLDGNGGLFGCINVDRGSTVTINVTGSAPDLETHPIKITNINNQGWHEAPLSNVVSTWNAGDPYTLTWEVPCDMGITQYQYQCVNHASMRGVINVSGTCPTPTPSPTSTIAPTPTVNNDNSNSIYVHIPNQPTATPAQQ